MNLVELLQMASSEEKALDTIIGTILKIICMFV